MSRITTNVDEVFQRSTALPLDVTETELDNLIALERGNAIVFKLRREEEPILGELSLVLHSRSFSLRYCQKLWFQRTALFATSRMLWK